MSIKIIRAVHGDHGFVVGETYEARAMSWGWNVVLPHEAVAL